MSSARAALTVLLIVCMSIIIVLSDRKESTTSKLPLTPKVYVKLLQTRRRDHMVLIQQMLKADYAKNYKMISMGMEQIFQVIKQSNQTLALNSYTPSEGFPTEQSKQEAVTLLLENTCLVADILLHFPEISYRVLDKVVNWRNTINWCIDFVNEFPHITDESIVELMQLVRQEINEDARSPDFINPYYKKVDIIDNPVKKKGKSQKKIKKGPKLTTRTEF